MKQKYDNILLDLNRKFKNGNRRSYIYFEIDKNLLLNEEYIDYIINGEKENRTSEFSIIELYENPNTGETRRYNIFEHEEIYYFENYLHYNYYTKKVYELKRISDIDLVHQLTENYYILKISLRQELWYHLEIVDYYFENNPLADLDIYAKWRMKGIIMRLIEKDHKLKFKK